MTAQAGEAPPTRPAVGGESEPSPSLQPAAGALGARRPRHPGPLRPTPGPAWVGTGYWRRSPAPCIARRALYMDKALPAWGQALLARSGGATYITLARRPGTQLLPRDVSARVGFPVPCGYPCRLAVAGRVRRIQTVPRPWRYWAGRGLRLPRCHKPTRRGHLVLRGDLGRHFAAGLGLSRCRVLGTLLCPQAHHGRALACLPALPCPAPPFPWWRCGHPVGCSVP